MDATGKTWRPDGANLRLEPALFRGLDAERGTLSVPIGRWGAAAAGGRIDLALVRLPARTGHAGEPVVFLTGGPGMSAIQQGEGRLFALFDALRDAGDVILLDQRGAGASDPLEDEADDFSLPPDRVVSRDEVTRALVERTRSRVARLREKGIDPGAFNTLESAADVADLIQALHQRDTDSARAVSPANTPARAADAAGSRARAALLGWSYGTHLAMAVMRRHPEVVTRAVLAGPEGPDHTCKLPSRIEQQLDVLSQRVRADEFWSHEIVDLKTTMRRAFERAEREPARVALPRRTGVLETSVGRFDLEWMVSEGIADTRFLRRVPLLFSALERGDFSVLERDRVAAGFIVELHTGAVSPLVRTCMDCASGATAARRERIDREAPRTLLGRTVDFPFPEICEAVGSPDLGDDFRSPRRCDHEVLFVTGTLDCRTPAENVADLAPSFPHHRHLVLEDAGHGDLLLARAVHDAALHFLLDGALSAERVKADPPFAFEVPEK